MKREVESLLEIVFKKRNRTYGAYVLRKKYGKNLIISMITALFILTGLFSYPVIASYINKTRLTDSERIVGVDVMNAPKDDITPPPPPPELESV